MNELGTIRENIDYNNINVVIDELQNKLLSKTDENKKLQNEILILNRIIDDNNTKFMSDIRHIKREHDDEISNLYTQLSYMSHCNDEYIDEISKLRNNTICRKIKKILTCTCG